MLLLAAIAIGTGSVLLLGYLLAAFAIGVIVFIKAGKMIKRIDDARIARPRVLPQWQARRGRADAADQRRAA
jgi:hypothetical protein